ncbi:MAG TPA: hypothetical protein VFN67_03115, partial [Polyangiales bacterium]|nr:hypothetical protein [Polyangiales bacterium]
VPNPLLGALANGAAFMPMCIEGMLTKRAQDIAQRVESAPLVVIGLGRSGLGAAHRSPPFSAEDL